MNNNSDMVSSLDGKSNDTVIFEDMGILNSDAMVVNNDNTVQDDLFLVSQTPEAIPCTSESDRIPTLTNLCQH